MTAGHTSSLRRPPELLAADDLGHLERVGLVPALAAGLLHDDVPRVGAPGAQRILVLPPDRVNRSPSAAVNAMTSTKPGIDFAVSSISCAISA